MKHHEGIFSQNRTDDKFQLEINFSIDNLIREFTVKKHNNKNHHPKKQQQNLKNIDLL